MVSVNQVRELREKSGRTREGGVDDGEIESEDDREHLIKLVKVHPESTIMYKDGVFCRSTLSWVGTEGRRGHLYGVRVVSRVSGKITLVPEVDRS